MGIEQDVSTVAFDAFAEVGELNGEDVDVIVDRNVEALDEDGNVRYYAAVVHAKSGCLPVWAAGDLLETCAGNLYLRQLISDDGFIQRIEASP